MSIYMRFQRSAEFSDLKVECGTDTKGVTRKAGIHMDFGHYEICNESGEWEPKDCPNHSVFWSLISCCVPLGLFPMHDYCL